MTQTIVKPHTQRKGWLKNGNPPGDLSTAPRCGAKTRKATSCRGPAMKNGRCRMHGGSSTGPKTPEGKKKISMAHWKTGRFSKKAIEQRSHFRKLLRDSHAVLKMLRG